MSWLQSLAHSIRQPLSWAIWAGVLVVGYCWYRLELWVQGYGFSTEAAEFIALLIMIAGGIAGFLLIMGWTWLRSALGRDDR